MTRQAACTALVFGATGRLGSVMRESLGHQGIKSIAITRHMMSNYRRSGELPAFDERIMLVDASIDYANLHQHEADKQALVAELAKRCRIELVASFSSGATDFDDARIVSPFYRDYKRLKEDNLAFFQSLRARLFYPKIYTLIGPNSHAVKTTGWVNVLEQASISDDVFIAHPHEPRSWVAEDCVGSLFASFAAGVQPDYLAAPVCGTFQLADIVSFCEVRRGCRLSIRPGQATPWLDVPYVAPRPDHVDGCACDLHATLASLYDDPPPP